MPAQGRRIRTRQMKQRSEGAGPPLALEILDYLVRNPEAKDTATGIVQWWLTEQHVRQTLRDVKAAVKSLVEQGLVLESRAPDGRTYFSLSKRCATGTRRLSSLEKQMPAAVRSQASGKRDERSKRK